MFPRSEMYQLARQLHQEKRVSLAPDNDGPTDVSSSREELGVFLRLWLVILVGVAVILFSSWLVTHAEMDLAQKSGQSGLVAFR